MPGTTSSSSTLHRLPAAADALMLAGCADAVLVCARAAYTRVDELEAACLLLRTSGTPGRAGRERGFAAAAWSPGAQETRAARRRYRRWVASVEAAGREA